EEEPLARRDDLRLADRRVRPLGRYGAPTQLGRPAELRGFDGWPQSALHATARIPRASPPDALTGQRREPPAEPGDVHGLDVELGAVRGTLRRLRRSGWIRGSRLSRLRHPLHLLALLVRCGHLGRRRPAAR